MITQVFERRLEVSEAAPIPPEAIGAAEDGGDLAPRVLSELAAIFSALGEPTRLRIVNALARGELCVGDIASALGLAVPAVSQHLRILRGLRVVRNRRAGKLVYYALDDAHVFDLFTVALAHVRRETA